MAILWTMPPPFVLTWCGIFDRGSDSVDILLVASKERKWSEKGIGPFSGHLV